MIRSKALLHSSNRAKEIKLCLVDPSTNEIKEVYKFSAKAMVGVIGGDDGMSAALKQKRLLDMVEGFFLQIDV